MYVVKMYLENGSALKFNCDNPQNIVFKTNGSLEDYPVEFYGETPINIQPQKIVGITYEYIFRVGDVVRMFNDGNTKYTVVDVDINNLLVTMTSGGHTRYRVETNLLTLVPTQTN